jgi:TonB family protein
LSRLNPFGPAETDAYINHRLSVAGYEGTQLFTPEARAVIAAWSKGIPRNINNLCFNALSLGYALRRKDIDLSLVQEAASDLELSPLFSKQYRSHQPVTAASPRGAVEVFTHELTPGVGLATIPDSIPAATCPKEPAAVPAPDSFGDDSFPAERVALAAEATPPSPPQPIRTSGDRRAWRHQLLRKVAPKQKTAHYNLPSSFAPVLVGVILLVIAAAGVFYLHRGIAHSAAATRTNPARVASPPSKAVNGLPGVRSANDPVPVVSQPLIVVHKKSQPVHQAQHSDASISTSQPASPESAGRPAWDGQNLNPEFFASLAGTPRWPATVGRGGPPDRSTVASDAPVDTIQKVVPGDLNIPFALPLTSKPVPVGSRLEDAQLVLEIPPIYPPAAKQTRVQGTVVIHAVIDAAGKLTDPKVVSGPPLLQAAALDSVRKWKYRPAYLNDEPVPKQVLITVDFRLH